MAGARDSELLPRTAACPQDFRSPQRSVLCSSVKNPASQPTYLPTCLSGCMSVLSLSANLSCLSISPFSQSAHRHLPPARMSYLSSVFFHPSCSLSCLSLVLSLTDYTSRLTNFLTDFMIFSLLPRSSLRQHTAVRLCISPPAFTSLNVC